MTSPVLQESTLDNVVPTPGPGRVLALSAWSDPRRPWSWQVDGIVMAVLALVTLATRWGLRARYIYGWDSYLFAMGVRDYNIIAAQPHVPGFPVFVAWARIFTWFTGDVMEGLVLVSVISSTGAVVLLYGFVREFGSIRAAVVASGLFLLAPVFLFHGMIGLSYVTEAPLTIGIAWLAWRTRQRASPRNLLLLGAAWSTGVGARQSLFFSLAPVVAWALLWPLRPLREMGRRLGLSAAAGLAATVPWFLGIIHGAGGLDRWLWASHVHARDWVFERTVLNTGFFVVREKADRYFHYYDAEHALVPALVALIILAALSVRRPWTLRPREWLGLPRGATGMFAVWLVPGVLMNLGFYTLTLFRDHSGYVLVTLPGLYALFGWISDACVRTIERQDRFPRLRPGISVAAVALLLAPSFGLVQAEQPWVRSVRENDHAGAQWTFMPKEFPPNETALLSESSTLYFHQYYPDYAIFHLSVFSPLEGRPWAMILHIERTRVDLPFYEAFDRAAALPPHVIPGDVRRILVLDGHLADRSHTWGRVRDDVPLEELTLPNGHVVHEFTVVPERPHIEDYLELPPS